MKMPQATALDSIKADPAELLALAGKPPDAWQAGLLRSDSRRILMLCCRQAGKSTTAASLALKAALLSEGALVLLLSPTLRQSGELFRDKVLRLYNALGRPVATTQESALQMTLANGSRIISLPGDEETIRGYSGVTLLVIDEAARVDDSLYYSVRPMIAVSGGRLVALSTPFGKRGWFHKEWQGERDGWERVRVTADQCPRIPASFLAEELRSLGKEWYDQEYGCEFNDGSSTPLFPAEWLNRAAQLAETLRGKARKAVAIGCDPAEGGDRSVWAVVDEYGLMYLLSLSTPDTAVITSRTIALMKEYGIPPNRVCFDRGGGGKQHADRLRDQGYPVRTIAFGESVTIEPRRGMANFAERVDAREERYAYKNRRAQLAFDLRELLDPARPGHGFAIPAEYAELRRQMAPIPLLHDKEGRIMMLPKHKATAESKEKTLVDLIGCSPDEFDALALAVHGLLHRPVRAKVGAM